MEKQDHKDFGLDNHRVLGSLVQWPFPPHYMLGANGFTTGQERQLMLMYS